MDPLRCPHCQYELRGLRDNRCPECGKAFDRAALASMAGFQKDRAQLHRILFWVCAYPLLALIPVYGSALAATVQLGHWPRAYLDDPKGLGPAVRSLGAAGVFAVMNVVPVFFVCVVLLVVCWVLAQRDESRRRTQEMVCLAAVCAAMWAGAMVVYAIHGHTVVNWLLD